MYKEKQEHYFIFKANCYKRTIGDDIVFKEKYNDLWEYGENTKAYQFIGEYFTYEILKPQHVVNIYLNNYPRAKIDGTEVFIVLHKSNKEKNVRLVYYSDESKKWEEINSNDEEFIDWNIISLKQSQQLYYNFMNFIQDYNNKKPNSHLEKKYLINPIPIGV